MIIHDKQDSVLFHFALTIIPLSQAEQLAGYLNSDETTVAKQQTVLSRCAYYLELQDDDYDKLCASYGRYAQERNANANEILTKIQQSRQPFNIDTAAEDLTLIVGREFFGNYSDIYGQIMDMYGYEFGNEFMIAVAKLPLKKRKLR